MEEESQNLQGNSVSNPLLDRKGNDLGVSKYQGDFQTLSTWLTTFICLPNKSQAKISFFLNKTYAENERFF